MDDQRFKQFIAWAGRKGYDTAHTYDTERSKWIPFGGMTAELWICWQAACEHSPSERPPYCGSGHCSCIECLYGETNER